MLIPSILSLQLQNWWSGSHHDTPDAQWNASQEEGEADSHRMKKGPSGQTNTWASSWRAPLSLKFQALHGLLRRHSITWILKSPVFNAMCLMQMTSATASFKNTKLGLTSIFYQIIELKGDFWVTQQLSVCLQLRAWSWSPGIESHIGLLQGTCFSLCLCFYLYVCLSWKNKYLKK